MQQVPQKQLEPHSTRCKFLIGSKILISNKILMACGSRTPTYSRMVAHVFLIKIIYILETGFSLQKCVHKVAYVNYNSHI